jgi:hypothetical protein
MGAQPWRLGRAKLLVPFPPYVVPSKENNAVFWLIGMSWPSHCAQPLGAKPPVNILISARNGFDMNISPDSFCFYLSRLNLHSYQITQVPISTILLKTTASPASPDS